MSRASGNARAKTAQETAAALAGGLDGEAAASSTKAPKRRRAPKLPGSRAPPGLLEAGIDEAGRGPVMGPLVVAGVATDNPRALREMGCKDSKLLTPAMREKLDRLIRQEPGVRIEVRFIEAAALDAERGAGVGLNEVERLRFVEVARALGAPRVVVDAADVDAKRFGRLIQADLGDNVAVVSEHRADTNHVTVAAASIVAKVARDRAISDLARRLERQLNMELGSGYASDPKTRAFLAAWLRQFRAFPEGTRASWEPARAAMDLVCTPRLETFVNTSSE